MEGGLTLQRLSRGFAQFDLLVLEVAQVSVVDFGYAVDSKPCRHHETHLPDDRRHDPQVALPVESIK